MRSIRFLKKLHLENKLDLVEPSKDISSDYLRKSANSYKAAVLLFEKELHEEAVSMTYYSMYHMLTALLFKAGIKCENHSGAIILLKELFNIDNSSISSAKKERIDKQYYTDFKIVNKDAQDSVKSAEEFRAIILSFIEQIKNEEINKIRDVLRKELD
tara:strand:- start:26773 stop:27246 length:474 start_codon:yes stop_codon:yes gene_type:complete